MSQLLSYLFASHHIFFHQLLYNVRWPHSNFRWPHMWLQSQGWKTLSYTSCLYTLSAAYFSFWQHWPYGVSPWSDDQWGHLLNPRSDECSKCTGAGGHAALEVRAADDHRRHGGGGPAGLRRQPGLIIRSQRGLQRQLRWGGRTPRTGHAVRPPVTSFHQSCILKHTHADTGTTFYFVKKRKEN